MIKMLTNGDLDIHALEISDVIDIDVLQKFQDNFAVGMNIASVTVDIDGNPITNPSSYTRFCIDFTHSTKIGDDRCAASHSEAGRIAAETEKPYVFRCHAGLIDFAAPIMINGTLIGTILGGQILTNDPDEASFRKVAKEIGVNEDEYADAAKEVYRTKDQNVAAAAEVLFIVANALSETGYERLRLNRMSKTLADNLNQLSATMEELSASSIEVSSNQHSLADEISNIKNVSLEINTVLDAIKNISDQTNMLGLNAAIEAARAKEYGLGFGVVATEIRNLSQESRKTADNITNLTQLIQSSVDATLTSSSNTLLNTEQQTAAIEEMSSSLMELTELASNLTARS